MRLSVVLLTWNSVEFVPGCLDSLLPQIPDDSEIIVVDNGSVDDTKTLIRKNYPGVHLLENDTNLGVGPARNQGLQIAQGDYILVLDIDTVVKPNAISALCGGMDNDPQVGVSGARLVDIDGDLQYTCRLFPTVLSKFLRQLPNNWQDRFLRDEEFRDWAHDSPRYIGYVIGACQMIRKEALDDVGPYDPLIFYGPEDVDFCLRMWKAGWKVQYNPQAEITHIERRITRKRPWKNPIFWKHVKGLGWYFWKHKYLLRAPKYDLSENY